MISLEKLRTFTPLQKLPKNVVDLGKQIVATGFENFPKVQKSPNLVTLLNIYNAPFIHLWTYSNRTIPGLLFSLFNAIDC